MAVKVRLEGTVLREDGLRFDPDTGSLLAPASRIIRNPDNPRSDFESPEAKQAARELRADVEGWRDKGRGLCGTGFMEPLKARWEPGAHRADGSVKKTAKLILHDGDRRFLEFQDEYDWFPITIDDVNEEEAYDVGVRTSLRKRLLSPLEQGHVYARKMEEKGWNAKQCGDHYGVGEGEVRNRAALVTADRDVQEMVEEYPDSMSHGLLIDRYKNRISPQDKKELIQEASQGMSLAVLQEEVNQRAAAFKLAQDTRSAPDRETASRTRENERTGGGNVSRGEEVKGPSRQEAKQEVTNALNYAAANLETARKWLEKLPDDEKDKFSNQAWGIRRRLKEIFPEIP